MPQRTWQTFMDEMEALPAGTVVSVPKRAMPHPSSAGMREGVGIPEGQRHDWRIVGPNARGHHVKDMGDHYEVHIDRVDPSVDPVGHMVLDNPGFTTGILMVGGMMAGQHFACKDGWKPGLVVGALLAGLVYWGRA